VNAAPWEHIVQREVSRFGSIAGHDADDLAQEARVAVMRALSHVDEARGEAAAATYVRAAVRRALINIKRDSVTQGRMPHAGDGTPLPRALVSLATPINEDGGTIADVVRGESPDAEDEASARELVRALEAHIGRYEMAQLRAALVEGAKLARARLRTGENVDEQIERARMRAKSVLSALLADADRVDAETD